MEMLLYGWHSIGCLLRCTPSSVHVLVLYPFPHTNMQCRNIQISKKNIVLFYIKFFTVSSLKHVKVS